MLSDQTIAIVKSTAPILQEHGETLTKHFYKRMFAHNPEVAPYFNPANQGAGLQQKALAGAICAYAANIDNLAALGGAVELIAQKHVSLQIKPEHYPIVGENLLASIQEVLGAGATEEVVKAWGEAYGFLADIMIGREKQIYKEHAEMPGGWQGFKSLQVIKKEKESDVITSIYLAQVDGSDLPTFKPGQYITVRVLTPSGSTTMRNYSLSDKSGQTYFRISVKRELGLKADTPDGFVSNFIHNEIEVGSTLEIAPPCGEFLLDLTEKHERPLFLLAAGVGVTPILSMLLSALEAMPERQVIFVYGSINEESQAFKKVIDGLAAKHSNLKIHYRYSNPISNSFATKSNVDSGFVDAALIDSLLPQHNADYYFCGPKAFMLNIYEELMNWGIPSSQINFEFFGPRQELESPKENLKCPF